MIRQGVIENIKNLIEHPKTTAFVASAVLTICGCVGGYFFGLYLWKRPCEPNLTGDPCDAAANLALSVWFVAIPISLALGLTVGFLIFAYLNTFIVDVMEDNS